MWNEADWPEISRHIWDTKYRYRRGAEVVDESIADTWRRVARAAAAVEEDPALWEARFLDGLLSGFRFLPGGRILANAGTPRQSTTMFNCYVMGTIDDSIDGIFSAVRESALTQKQGGGVGYDFSTIRPRGTHIEGVDSTASGPLSFMHVLDATCRTIMSAGQRRGAQMGILRCDHPDIEDFIDAKHTSGALRMFNLSVAVTDAFLEAVKADAPWDLVFAGEVVRTVQARQLWDRIMRSTYDYAEPGVFMVDRVNRLNNLHYCEEIRATNPCGEQPLPPYGACLLGSVNLTRFVLHPFQPQAAMDFDAIAEATRLAVRFLDNIIEISNYPLEQQRAEAHAKRRMGIGITGLADALAFLGLRYGSTAAAALAGKVMKCIALHAYEASADLAREKGPFPLFDAGRYLGGAFAKKFPKALRERIRRQGMRNSHLTSVAPTGTISLLAGNISSGIEPLFALHYARRIRTGNDEETREHEVLDYAYAEYCRQKRRPVDPGDLPPAFVTTDDILPAEHLRMQAAVQLHVDSSISKTVNVPRDTPFDQFRSIYMQAYDMGLKGCTTFRPSEYIEGVLVRQDERPPDARPDAPPDAHPNALPRRPDILSGTTYKIKTPLSPDAYYVTINDIADEGRTRPYEVFINTKNLQHLSWIVAMTRLISAVFRREPDPSFLVEELKSIYDPTGGYFSDGEYVPSLPAELGRVIAAHLERLGIMAPCRNARKADPQNDAGHGGKQIGAGICPMCRQPGLQNQENCLTCRYCGYSKCS
ncbi:MAG: adenosylcobalamin-dependent ribonucleoside-diphosphate reductase [Lentisphaeria bacterium]|nr:adenosylcobalamin-dependent ribonucleoside-diphosphate reductase [Lentisphaeria bacterium]